MKFKDALQNHSKKGRLITLRWLKASKMNKFIILRLSEAMKNEVNPLIVKRFFMSHKKSFIGTTIFVLHFTDKFINSETIMLIDKINLLNFNGCILKGT